MGGGGIIGGGVFGDKMWGVCDSRNLGGLVRKVNMFADMKWMMWRRIRG